MDSFEESHNAWYVRTCHGSSRFKFEIKWELILSVIKWQGWRKRGPGGQDVNPRSSNIRLQGKKNQIYQLHLWDTTIERLLYYLQDSWRKWTGSSCREEHDFRGNLSTHSCPRMTKLHNGTTVQCGNSEVLYIWKRSEQQSNDYKQNPLRR